MDEVIRDIFNKGKALLRTIDKIIYYFRIQNFYTALNISNVLLDNLISYIENIIEKKDYFNVENELVNINLINQMLEELLKSQEDKDWILLTDLYEIRLIGFLLSLQEVIIYKENFFIDKEKMNKNISKLSELDTCLNEALNISMGIEEILSNGYSVEYTATGDFTLAIRYDEKKKYFHTNNRVMNEALTLANNWYREDKNQYIIYGLGLGHHISGLLELDDSISIEVYESDINIIKLACAFSDLYELMQRAKFKLIYDPQFISIRNRIASINKNVEFVIHYPSLSNIKSISMKERFEDYFVQYSSIKNQLRFLNSNFIENIKYEHSSVDVLEDKFRNKDLYIVAAGPSLDKNFMQLKNVSKQGIILCTGTVFRKLLKEGIRPDYVIVTDASPYLYKLQIEGFEESGVPLIYLSTACKDIIKNYKGEKYIVLQREYDLSEKEAEKRGCMLFNTGSSVSTTALDIGIALCCRRVIFLGLDLSYPNNLSHASDISSRGVLDISELRQVKDISGKTLYTSKAMDMYRRWIERRIMGITTPEIINATEGGVYVKGMKYVRLQDIINSDKDIY